MTLHYYIQTFRGSIRALSFLTAERAPPQKRNEFNIFIFFFFFKEIQCKHKQACIRAISVQTKLKTEVESVAVAVFSSPSSSMFPFLPFQQSQCLAAGELTERLGITYLTDNVSSVVSKMASCP